MNRKFCMYCNTYQAEDQMRVEWRGTSRRPVKKLICASCKESKDANHGSIAARDAYGMRTSQRNSAVQSIASTYNHSNNNNKE